MKELLARVRGLRGDGGATMIIGTWMGLGLIGAIWYMLGVQDAVLRRDHAQEAADSIAFAGAVMHARGMNLIAAVNLVMMVLVVVLLLVKVYQEFLHNMLNLVTMWPEPECRTEHMGRCCGQRGINLAADSFVAQAGGEACSISTATANVQRGAADVLHRYEHGILRPGVLPALARAERTVQQVTPAGGFTAGATAGEPGFRAFGFPIGLTMVPPSGEDAVSPVPAAGGLPVQGRVFHEMCSRVSGTRVERWVFDKARERVRPSSRSSTPPRSTASRHHPQLRRARWPIATAPRRRAWGSEAFRHAERGEPQRRSCVPALVVRARAAVGRRRGRAASWRWERT